MQLLGGLTQGSGGQSQNTSTNSNSTTNVDYPAYLDTLAQNIGTQANGLISSPFPTYDVNKVFAPFQPTQNQAFNQVGNNQTSWQPYFNSATSGLNSGASTANGYFNQAGANQTPTQAASPYFSQASQAWNAPGVAQSYMNPYLANSVNYANQLASQNFTQNVMPSLTQQFVAGGGGGDGSRGALGTPQYQKAADWALTNFNNAIAGNTQNALSQGYFNSANQFNADQSRLAGIGSAAANNAATGTGLLTNLGSAQNGAAANNAGIFGQLGNSFSNNNLTNSNALLQVGNQQQQNAQNPLSFNYQQFLNQQNWPYQLLSWGTGIESGLKTPMTSTTNSTSNSSTTGSANSSASPLGTGIGALSAFGSMFNPGQNGSSPVGGAFGNIFGGLGNIFGNGGSGAGGALSSLGSDTQVLDGAGFKRGGRPGPKQGYFASGGHANDWMGGAGSLLGSLIGSIWGPIGSMAGKQAGADGGQALGDAIGGKWDMVGNDFLQSLIPKMPSLGDAGGMLGGLGGGGGGLGGMLGGITDMFERGGHFSRHEPRRYATGGLAVVSNAGRAQTRNYLQGQERKQSALQAAQRAASKPLATKGNGFFGGRDRAPKPAAALPMTRSPGFFAHV